MRAVGLALVVFGVAALCACGSEDASGPVPPPGSQGVHADLYFNVCPSIVTMVSVPSRLIQGDTARLEAIAEDADGDPIFYQWTSEDGELSEVGTPSVVFRCVRAGEQRLTTWAYDSSGCVTERVTELPCDPP